MAGIKPGGAAFARGTVCVGGVAWIGGAAFASAGAGVFAQGAGLAGPAAGYDEERTFGSG